MTTEHEEALIGCVLVGADPAYTGVQAADFYQPRNMTIWQAVLDLREQGVRPDVQAVATHPGIDTMHVMDIYGRATVAGNADHYANKVLEEAARRRITQACIRAQQAAEEGEDPAGVVDNLRADVDRITTTASTDVTSIGDWYPSLVDSFLQGTRQGDPTPWPDVNRHIHGLQPGRLYVVAARPGVGKSVAALNMAMHMSMTTSKATYFASLEMPTDEIGTRMIANMTGISLSRLTSGDLTPDDRRILKTIEGAYRDMRIRICDKSSQSLAMIRDGARKVTQREQLGMVVVDYLQLMEAPGARQGANRTEIVGSFSRGLKGLAKDLHVPVVALAQLRRPTVGEKENPPQASDLRESGSIENDADVILMLHPDKDIPGDVDLIIRKNRNGPKDITVPLRLRGHVSSLKQP